MNKFFVTPRCCKEVDEHATVYLSLPIEYFDGDLEASKAMKPVWKIRSYNVRWGPEITWSTEVVKFCPHCGTPLPDIEPSNLKKVYVLEKSGDYCGLCKNRNRECTCKPPEFAWKPKRK